MGVVNKRFVCKSFTGGWRIWNRRTKKWWGIKFNTFPEELIKELNGENRESVIIKLVNNYRK